MRKSPLCLLCVLLCGTSACDRESIYVISDLCPKEQICGDMCCHSDELCSNHECIKPPEPTCDPGLQCGPECCSSNQICVDNACLNIGCNTDEDCKAGFMCQNKACIPITCADGFILDDGKCVPMECAYDQILVNGECVQCTDDVKCGDVCCDTNQMCIDNTCINIDCYDDSECPDAQICQNHKCIPQIPPNCISDEDCNFIQYCDLNTNTCVDIEFDPNACTFTPEVGEFSPQIKWHWPQDLPGGKPSVHPKFDQVMSNAIVINLIDDSTPELIFTSFAKGVEGSGYTGLNVLRVISGRNGEEIATHPDIKFRLARDIAAAKVDEDDYPEIVVPGQCDNGSECTFILNLKYSYGNTTTPYVFEEVAVLEGNAVYPRFANLDGGKYPQIITSLGIIEYTPDKGYRYRCNADFGDARTGYTVADLDGDGEMEIVGAQIYDKNCNVISTDTIPNGTVLADLDLVNDHQNGRLDVEQIVETIGETGSPDVATPPPGKVHAYKVFKNDGKFHRELMWETEMPIHYPHVEAVLNEVLPIHTYSDGTPFKCDRKYNETFDNTAEYSSPEYVEYRRRFMCSTGGGPLVAADFNGDKKPDIGLATGWSYSVFDGATGNILWTDTNTQDYSSKATGSSVFDFEGDGIAEVLYADETALHIYSGPGSKEKDPITGYNLPEHLIDYTQIPHSSYTLNEYPIIADIDSDNNSEILIVSNDYKIRGTYGITALYDPNHHWVRTRSIWNQYDYHITNINDDGTVPKRELQNWKQPNLNNFRQNTLPEGIFNAPNLVPVSITSTCGVDEVGDPLLDDDGNPMLVIQTDVKNVGSGAIQDGPLFSIYLKDPIPGVSDYLLESLDPFGDWDHTTQDVLSFIFPWDGTIYYNGQNIPVNMPASLYLVVDDPNLSKEGGMTRECNEDDNVSRIVKIDRCQ